MKDILIKARRAIRFLFYRDVSIKDQILVSNTLDDSELEIPSSDIEKYKFVLEPLAEIAPDKFHPTLKKSYKQLYTSLLDKAKT